MSHTTSLCWFPLPRDQIREGMMRGLKSLAWRRVSCYSMLQGPLQYGAPAPSSELGRSGAQLLSILSSCGDTPDGSGHLVPSGYRKSSSVLGSLSTAARPLGTAGPDGRHRSGQWAHLVWPLRQSDRRPACCGRAHHPPVFSPDWQRRLSPEGLPAVLTGTVTDDGVPQLLLAVAGRWCSK